MGSSVSPYEKMSVSCPATPSESQAMTHCASSSSCVFSPSWNLRETHPLHHWGQFLLRPVFQKPLALFHVLAEFLSRRKDHVQAFATPIISTIVPAHDMIEIKLVIATRILAEWAEGESQ